MATGCKQDLDIGRNLIVRWAEACGSEDPLSTADTPLTYKPLGYTTTKAINESTRTTDANNDTSGAYQKTLQTGFGMEIPVSVFTSADIVDVSTQEELRIYRRTEIAAGRQATVWLELTNTQLSVKEYVFCLVNDVSRSYGNEDVNTGDFNFMMIATDDSANPAYQTEAIV